MDLLKTNTETMFSSRYLVEQINLFRKAEGNQTEVAHFTLLAKIEKRFETKIAAKKIIVGTYLDNNKQERKQYELPFEDCLRVLLDESEIVQDGVVERLKELQKPQHLTLLEILDIAREGELKRLDAVKRAELLEEVVVTMTPKAAFFDTVSGSTDAISISITAKILNFKGVGQNKMFEILREQGILMHNNVPYQTLVDRGYFRVIEQKYNKPNGEVHISIKTLVYQKGVDFLNRVLLKLGHIKN